LYELPDDYFSKFVPTVLGLRAEDITRAAATHIHPERLLTVVVGDREKIGPSLETLGAVREVQGSRGSEGAGVQGSGVQGSAFKVQ
jgi:zinc protease